MKIHAPISEYFEFVARQRQKEQQAQVNQTQSNKSFGHKKSERKAA
ncbi:hypothetical protein RCC89_12220 [Cytophagaceae bacterium ABcell3]|nr:hypothetical protein RCC89_12220 [Cytophagaceae bacterium ABcell3]